MPVAPPPFQLFLYSLEVTCSWFGMYLPDLFLMFAYICNSTPPPPNLKCYLCVLFTYLHNWGYILCVVLILLFLI